MWRRVLRSGFDVMAEKRMAPVRRIMSKSFPCTEAWEKRLSSPILSKVNVEEMYFEIDSKLNQIGRVSPVDVDIFANCVREESYLDETEDLLVRLRMTPEAGGILPSTHHSVIRAYLDHGKIESLFRILNDRLNFGIFPDDFCYILMMDHFLKNGSYHDAAQVAAIRALQEDFSDQLLNLLSLYSCHKYLADPLPWTKEKEEEAVVDDGEEVRVRVAYLRNPYFDDHFDLTDPVRLTGKTLLLVGAALPNSIGLSYQLVGSCLFQKWDRTNALFNKIASEGKSIHSESLGLIEKFLNELPADAQIDHLDQVKDNLNKLKSSADTDSLLAAVEKQLKSLAEESEASIVDKQLQTYADWEQNRVDRLNEELLQLKKQSTLKSIQEELDEMKKKEDELFFFERENELELAIENKRVRYPKKWTGKKKKKKEVSTEYIPPEIVKNYSSR